MGSAVKQLGGFQQRLGGNAAGIEAGAAEGIAAIAILPFVDAGHREAVLPGADGGRVSARSAANDDHVELIGHGFRSRSTVDPDPRGSP